MCCLAKLALGSDNDVLVKVGANWPNHRFAPLMEVSF